MDTVDRIEQSVLREDTPECAIGDTVDVHYRIREGDKERVQIFNGTVIRIRRGGSRSTITVRRIVASEGVERIFPLNSPKLVKIVVRRQGKVRRAKLYYLRDRVGKAVKVKEKQGVRPEGKRGRASRKSRRRSSGMDLQTDASATATAEE